MENILESTSIVGCSVSVLFSLSTLVVLSCYREKTRPLKMKQHFSIALTLTNTIVLAGFQGLSSRSGCRTVTILLHYAVTASFAWIFVDVYFTMSCVRRKCMIHSFWRLAIIAWGTPVPFMFVALIFGLAVDYKFGSKAYSCWHSDHVVWSLIIPCTCLILGTTYMLIVSIHQLYLQYVIPINQSAKAIRSSESTRYSVKTNVTMLIITTFIWIFGCFIFWYPSAVNFQLIFGLSNGIQGLLLFFFYCIFCLELDLYVSDNVSEGISENLKYDDLNDVKIDVKSNASYEISSGPKIKHFKKLAEDFDQEKNYYSMAARGSQQSSEPDESEGKTLEKHCKETKVIVHLERKEIIPPSDEKMSIIKHKEASEENDKHHSESENTKEEVIKENNLKWMNSNKIGTIDPDIQQRKPKSISNSSSSFIPRDNWNGGEFDLIGSKKSRSSMSSHHSSNNSRCISSASIASIASLSQDERRTSRTSSNVSYTSSMGLNELESLFNNPDLMNQALPRKNRFMHYSSENNTPDQVSVRKRTGSKPRHTSLVNRRTSQIEERVDSERRENDEVRGENKDSNEISEDKEKERKSRSNMISVQSPGFTQKRQLCEEALKGEEVNDSGTSNTSTGLDNIKTDISFKQFASMAETR